MHDQFDVVLVWSLDRFTREGIQKTIFYLQQRDGLGVNFKSYTEQYLDTDNGVHDKLHDGSLF